MIDTKARQPIQLAFNWEAEVKPQGPGARGDSVTATRPSERPLFDEHIMEEVCAPGNMQAALKRVRANKGSPGSDGMSVEELPAYLRTHWPEIKDQLLQGTYQPQVVRRVAIPKPVAKERARLSQSKPKLKRGLRPASAIEQRVDLLHKFP